MTNYLCIKYNRGARIGHQVHDYFAFLAICDFYNLEPVYSPFLGNAKHFENVLCFNTLYALDYYKNKPEAIETELFRLGDIGFKHRHSTLFTLDLNKPNQAWPYLLKPIPPNIYYRLYKQHKNALKDTYSANNPYNTQNNLIAHIRRGDIVNMESRFLNIDYFYSAIHNIVTSSSISYNTYITAETNVENLDMFTAFNTKLLIEKSDIEAFYYLVNADIVVGSPSGFSYLAYILGKGQYYRSPKDWVLYDTDVKCAYS